MIGRYSGKNRRIFIRLIKYYFNILQRENNNEFSCWREAYTTTVGKIKWLDRNGFCISQVVFFSQNAGWFIVKKRGGPVGDNYL